MLDYENAGTGAARLLASEAMPESITPAHFYGAMRRLWEGARETWDALPTPMFVGVAPPAIMLIARPWLPFATTPTARHVRIPPNDVVVGVRLRPLQAGETPAPDEPTGPEGSNPLGVGYYADEPAALWPGGSVLAAGGGHTVCFYSFLAPAYMTLTRPPSPALAARLELVCVWGDRWLRWELLAERRHLAMGSEAAVAVAATPPPDSRIVTQRPTAVYPPLDAPPEVVERWNFEEVVTGAPAASDAPDPAAMDLTSPKAVCLVRVPLLRRVIFDC